MITTLKKNSTGIRNYDLTCGDHRCFKILYWCVFGKKYTFNIIFIFECLLISGTLCLPAGFAIWQHAHKCRMRQYFEKLNVICRYLIKVLF